MRRDVKGVEVSRRALEGFRWQVGRKEEQAIKKAAKITFCMNPVHTQYTHTVYSELIHNSKPPPYITVEISTLCGQITLK